MKTAIIETHYHSEYLSTLIQLFDKPLVFTLRSVYEDLPETSKSKATFVFKHPNQKTRDFINDIDTTQFDLTFVNTIQETLLDLPNWKSFFPKNKSVLTIHNVNAWFLNSIIPQPRLNFLHSIDSWLSQRKMNDLIDRFEYLSVCYEPMLEPLESYFNKPSLFIPFSLSERSVIEDKPENETWFTIPGTVDHRRRDYSTILNAFKPILQQHSEVRLFLLGSNHDRLQFDEIPNSEEQIITYDKTVPRETYDSVLRNSDFVIIPCKQYTSTINVTDEKYGYTKSPNIHDAIRWRKPTITPDYLPLPRSLSGSGVRYSSYIDLIQKLQIILEPETIKRYKRLAYEGTEPYTLENTRSRVHECLNV